MTETQATTDGILTKESFSELYEKAFPAVAGFVSKMGGSFADARDIFHDALIILYEKQVAKTLDIYVPEQAYLLGISKHLWIRRHMAERSKVSLDFMENTMQIPDGFAPEPSTTKLYALLEYSGKSCIKLLQAFYYDKLSPQRIAVSFGYANNRSATVQKYKCLEKLRNKVKEISIAYEDFME